MALGSTKEIREVSSPKGVRRGLPQAHRIFRSDVQKGPSKGKPLVMGLIGVKFLAHYKDLFKGDAICSKQFVSL